MHVFPSWDVGHSQWGSLAGVVPGGSRGDMAAVPGDPGPQTTRDRVKKEQGLRVGATPFL